MTKPAIFISYSHKDEKWKDRLMVQLGVLQMQGSFEVWTDREIEAGGNWYQEIEDAMQKASVGILLVSANFLTSDFILKQEVGRLLERRDREGLRIFPIIVGDCAWQSVGWLARMQARPRDGRALKGMKPAQVDKELRDIVLEIAQIIERTSKATNGN